MATTSPGFKPTRRQCREDSQELLPDPNAACKGHAKRETADSPAQLCRNQKALKRKDAKTLDPFQDSRPTWTRRQHLSPHLPREARRSGRIYEERKKAGKAHLRRSPPAPEASARRGLLRGEDLLAEPLFLPACFVPFAPGTSRKASAPHSILPLLWAPEKIYAEGIDLKGQHRRKRAPARELKIRQIRRKIFRRYIHRSMSQSTSRFAQPRKKIS